MRIGIIGLGYVGLTLAVAAAARGIDVYGVETNSYIKECLKENRTHFYEFGLDGLLRKHNNKTFHVVEKFPNDIEFDAFVITVGTPLNEDGKTPNFEYIKTACMTINEVYDGSQLVILRSTVSVGTTRNIVLPFLAEMSHKSAEDVMVSMCPERTVEGKAVEELTNLPQIISGNNDKALEMAQQVFRRLTPCVVETSSLEEAELVKLYCNTYRDMTFAIGNAFCMAAQEFGVDGNSVIKHANYGYARSNIAKPGYVAGPCLEKDAYILINNMPECESRKFILAGREFNKSMENATVRWVREKVGEPSENKKIALSGMAFKGQPETSDLRGSSSLYIAQKLKAEGDQLILHDFVADSTELGATGLGVVCNSIQEACAEAEVLLILNNHKKYTFITPEEILWNKREKFSVLDAWDMCVGLCDEDRIQVSTLGNMFL